MIEVVALRGQFSTGRLWRVYGRLKPLSFMCGKLFLIWIGVDAIY